MQTISFKLEVFEGPMDLLLNLISKHKLNIYDIEISSLLEQYLAEKTLSDACLAGALDRGEPWGVWGGEIFERGVVIPRKRPRGRPRKNADDGVAA